MNLLNPVGVFLALYYSYVLWGGKGCLFTLGLLLSNNVIQITYQRKSK